VYFNGLFILAMAGLYALTGWEALLLVILVRHIEVAHQLLPFLRLDGYYVVADLTGVPDLFARMKPILASVIPGREPDPRVTELKPWVRLVVTTWVLVVIPLLVFQLGIILLHAPRIFATAWDSFGQQRSAVAQAMGDGDVLAVLAGVVQVLILVIPLAGIVLTGLRLGRRGIRWILRSTAGRPIARPAVLTVTGVLVGALAYTWWPDGDYRPIGPRERGTLQQGLLALGRVPTGRPSLVVSEQADEPAPPESAAASTTTMTSPPVSTTAARRRVPPAPTTVAPRSTSTTRMATTTTAPRPSTTTIDADRSREEP
jgi:putative peptide zinc metalloprotease protein